MDGRAVMQCASGSTHCPEDDQVLSRKKEMSLNPKIIPKLVQFEQTLFSPN
ncbi:hypothetical protein JOB18_025126 [Solea senegalensis]|uniref:Uncharacterized protein n=1 Tax=Solea senegalensis TaxID=28829 RepID=A0AAV6QAI5_SOLSE|nr:hypothetical protein JOB18_025126 [Solea senegalensis]